MALQCFSMLGKQAETGSRFRYRNIHRVFGSPEARQAVADRADPADPRCQQTCRGEMFPLQHRFEESRRFNDIPACFFYLAVFDYDLDITVPFNTS
jgi:hypothetical protein